MRNKIIWSAAILQDVPVYPIAGNDKTAVMLSRKTGKLTAVNPDSGKILWEKNIQDLVRTGMNPEVEGWMLVVGGGKDIYVLDFLSGKIICRKSMFSAVTVLKWFRGSVLAGDADGGLYLLEPGSGKMEKIFSTDSPVNRISVDGKTVTVLSRDKVIRLSQNERK